MEKSRKPVKFRAQRASNAQQREAQTRRFVNAAMAAVKNGAPKQDIITMVKAYVKGYNTIGILTLFNIIMGS